MTPCMRAAGGSAGIKKQPATWSRGQTWRSILAKKCIFFWAGILFRLALLGPSTVSVFPLNVCSSRGSRHATRVVSLCTRTTSVVQFFTPGGAGCLRPRRKRLWNHACVVRACFLGRSAAKKAALHDARRHVRCSVCTHRHFLLFFGA